MIISASRRTDLPAFHADWLMSRIRAGFCEVANPFNPAQRSRVSLRPQDVDAFVFWTRNPVGLMPHLPELDRLGYRYTFLFTVVDYPRLLEPHAPPLSERLARFLSLSERLGAQRVIWRYDPIVLSGLTDEQYHRERFRRLADRFHGRTTRVIVSFLDEYARVRRRLRALEPRLRLRRPAEGDARLARLMRWMAADARDRGMTIQSCAEKRDLRPYGIEPGACIDARLIRELFGVSVPERKDPGQRGACRCAVSRDIGTYGTCRYGCLYCYAARAAPAMLSSLNPRSSA